MTRLCVVMDSIAAINYKKDSTLAMLWEAQARAFKIDYVELKDLYMLEGVPYADASQLTVKHDENNWFELKNKKRVPLAEFDIILMRKDPPFNEEYIYATYILEHAQRLGVLVANKPQSLRDANEKLYATHFPQCSPPTLVAQTNDKLRAFWQEHKDIVCKPLNGMGGASIFRLKEGDVNAEVVFETLTHSQTVFIMAQRFIPEIKFGDKRILMIEGEPVPHALARVPQGNDWRGNLAVGAKGKVQPLSERDKWICAQVGPDLRARGLYFVGLDVIGDYLTEINVTSPTGVREIDAAAGVNVSAMLMDVLVKYS